MTHAEIVAAYESIRIEFAAFSDTYKYGDDQIIGISLIAPGWIIRCVCATVQYSRTNGKIGTAREPIEELHLADVRLPFISELFMSVVFPDEKIEHSVFEGDSHYFDIDPEIIAMLGAS